MKRFLSLSAVVIMLVALTPAYVPAISNDFGSSYVFRPTAPKEEFCRYCGKSKKEAGNSKCPDSPYGQHHFATSGPSK